MINSLLIYYSKIIYTIYIYLTQGRAGVFIKKKSVMSDFRILIIFLIDSGFKRLIVNTVSVIVFLISFSTEVNTLLSPSLTNS